MNRVLINSAFMSLIPTSKIGWMLSDMQKGRQTVMIKLYYLVMESRHNPLACIPDTATRHLVMQMLAWMWCIVLSMWIGSILVFGVSATFHTILLCGVFVTVGVFETYRGIFRIRVLYDESRKNRNLLKTCRGGLTQQDDHFKGQCTFFSKRICVGSLS